MKFFQLLVIIGVSTIIFASCGKKEVVAPVVSEKIATTADLSAIPTPAVRDQINAEAVERERINNLNTLTEDNIKTQTEVQDGKTILKDRRLLVNYLTAEDVNSSESLMI